MNAKQTKLIEQAATVDVDGEGWRKRMDRWLDEKAKIRPRVCGLVGWLRAWEKATA